MPDNFEHALQLLLANTQFSALVLAKTPFSELVILVGGLLVLLLCGAIFYWVIKYFLLPHINRALARSRGRLLKAIELPLSKVIARIALLGPLIFYLATYRWFLVSDGVLLDILNKAFYVYLYINIALIFNGFLTIGGIIYNQQSFADDIPIKGILQVGKLVIFMVFAGLVIAELVNRSPFYLLSSLGALTAVLLLVFKDTIMGFVASIQIATNRLVANGDWIEMPEYGADGDVLEVGLHTVKVQNFDKTITIIPTYKLISESFKNWRGMSESDGRRIKRSFLIDVNSIHFVDDAGMCILLDNLKDPGFKQWLSDDSANETNLGLFRRYCEYYLTEHVKVNQDMTLMARLLPPSEYGVPLEVYCFSRNKKWVEYEKLQAEVLEHLLARLRDFSLRAFQRPADRAEKVMEH